MSYSYKMKSLITGTTYDSKQDFSWDASDHEDCATENLFLGRIITDVLLGPDQEELWFLFNDEKKNVRMYHDQDCCEDVHFSEIVGDWKDLIDTPITFFEERTQDGSDEAYDSMTWTFYEVRTAKGSATITWRGESNGYYSEEVDCEYLSARLTKQLEAK